MAENIVFLYHWFILYSLFFFSSVDLFQLKAAIEQHKQQTGEVLKKFELSEEQEEQQVIFNFVSLNVFHLF